MFRASLEYKEAYFHLMFVLLIAQLIEGKWD